MYKKYVQNNTFWYKKYGGGFFIIVKQRSVTVLVEGRLGLVVLFVL